MFDATLQILDIRALEAEENADHVFLAMVTGTHTTLPIAGPDGQPIVVPVPMGVLRIPMARDVALGLADSLKTEGEKVKKQSGLVVAGTQQADAVAKLHQKMKGN